MIWFYIAGSLLIASISWLDDLHPIPNRFRLIFHIGAALLAVIGIGYWHSLTLPLFGRMIFGIPGILFTLIWIVGMTNIYNFMDGIDGLAGSQAVIAGAGWIFLSWWTRQPLLLALSLFLTVACLGFLRFNWPPATIFMGDVGSAYLGYTFALLAVAGGQQRAELSICGILLLWPFCFDGAFTILRRWQRGDNIFRAHRSHLYQRLVIAGHSHRTVTLLYASLAFVGALLAIGWELQISGIDLLIAIILPMLAMGLIVFVHSQERTYRHKIHSMTAIESR